MKLVAVFAIGFLLSCGPLGPKTSTERELSAFVAEKPPELGTTEAEGWAATYFVWFNQNQPAILREGLNKKGWDESYRRSRYQEKVDARAKEIARAERLKKLAEHIRQRKPLASNEAGSCTTQRFKKDRWGIAVGVEDDTLIKTDFNYSFTEEGLLLVATSREEVLHYVWEHLNTPVPPLSSYGIWRGCGDSGDGRKSVIANFKGGSPYEVGTAINEVVVLVEGFALTKKELLSWGFTLQQIENLRGFTTSWASWWRLL